MSAREQVVTLICEAFECTEQELRGRNSARHLADARKVYAFICRYHLRFTFQHIAEYLGRDHSTIISGLWTLGNLITRQHPIGNEVRAIEMKLFNQSKL